MTLTAPTVAVVRIASGTAPDRATFTRTTLMCTTSARKRLRSAACALACLLVCAPPVMAEGALSQLYAPRPPAGAAFVRVVANDPARVSVTLGPHGATTAGGDTPATPYVMTTPDVPLAVQVGKGPAGTLSPRPDTYTTYIADVSVPPARWTAIDDTQPSEDAIKATLHFYNLIDGCEQAALVIEGGGAVFTGVQPRTAAARAINPVKASLAGRCGTVVSAPLALPMLTPASHYSIFLVGTAQAPVLRGQASQTE